MTDFKSSGSRLARGRRTGGGRVAALAFGLGWGCCAGAYVLLRELFDLAGLPDPKPVVLILGGVTLVAVVPWLIFRAHRQAGAKPQPAQEPGLPGPDQVAAQLPSMENVHKLVRAGRRIQAIGMLQQLNGLPLEDAVKQVEDMERNER